MLDRVRIVLVRPAGPTNVGSAARAMMNMGLRDLVLVAPRCDHLSEPARAYATRAVGLLETASVCATVAEALAGAHLSLATSAKGGFYRDKATLSAREAAALAQNTTAAGNRVAIAFGPEDRGLVLAELLQFDRVVAIPANDEYPVLNLAAAVMVVAYELRLAMSAAQPRAGRAAEPLADARRSAVLYEKLFDALERIGFFQAQQSPEHLRFAIRHLLGRAAMTENEVDVLIGMANQIRAAARLRADDPV